MDVGFLASQLDNNALALGREILDGDWHDGGWTDHQRNSDELLFITDRR
jgi:hypothetical protein